MRIFLTIIFIIVGRLVLAQTRVTDSLNTLLKEHPQEDTTQVKLLNELSFWSFKNDPEKSFQFADKALALANRLSFQKGIGEAKDNLAVYYLMIGNPDVSLELALEAARIGEKEQLKELVAYSYSIVGTVYHNQLDYSKARYYLSQAEKLTTNALTLSKVFNAFGAIARDKKKYDSALFYYKKALAIMRKAGEEYRVPEVINNIGQLYIRQGKNVEALEYYFKALAAAKKNENRRTEALALVNIGSTLLSEKKYSQAEPFLLQSLALFRRIGDRKILLGNYMALGQLKNETGKFDEAHRFISAFYELKDSLQNVDKTKKIAELEIRYETERKDHAIELLQRDKKIQSLWANFLIAALVLAIIVFVLIYNLQRYKERKNRQILNFEIEQLTTRHKELSEKYKNILTRGDGKSIDSQDQRLLKKVIEAVENNMSDPLFNVERMAKEIGMSRTNMNRKIKAITGFPPSELIRSIRLRKAAILLLNQANSVSQISFTVGFDNHSYFSKAFKKHFGVSPSEYLQSQGKMAD